MFYIYTVSLRLALSPSLWSVLVNGKCFPCACGESVTAVVGWNALTNVSEVKVAVTVCSDLCLYVILSTCLSLLREG